MHERPISIQEYEQQVEDIEMKYQRYVRSLQQIHVNALQRILMNHEERILELLQQIHEREMEIIRLRQQLEDAEGCQSVYWLFGYAGDRLERN